jgi:hypothetical protein
MRVPVGIPIPWVPVGMPITRVLVSVWGRIPAMPVSVMFVLPFLAAGKAESHQNQQAHKQAFHRSALP